MAKYDIVEIAQSAEDAYAPATATFSGGAPAEGDLLLYFIACSSRTLTTPPSGSSLVVQGDADAMNTFIYAKIAGASESASQSVTLSDEIAGRVLTVIRIAGSFASLSAVTATAKQTILSTPFDIPASATSVAGASRAFAVFTSVLTAYSAVTVSGYTNSFTAVTPTNPPGTNNTWFYIGSRAYGSADAGVQTTPTVDNTPFGNAWMVKVDDNGGGGGVAFRPYYITG